MVQDQTGRLTCVGIEIRMSVWAHESVFPNIMTHVAPSSGLDMISHSDSGTDNDNDHDTDHDEKKVQNTIM